MTKATSVLILMTTALLARPATAGAQGPRYPVNAGLLNFNVGAQPQQRTVTTAASFPLYDELATVTTTQGVHNGPLFEVAGGLRVWHNLVAAVGFSAFSGRKSTSSLVASIPHPAFFDQPRIVTGAAAGLEHSEHGVHLQAVWLMPITDRIDVALSAGPSFIRVRHQLAAVTVPAGTQDISVTQETQSGTAIGANVGFDGSYMFTPRYGAGLFIRYAGGSVDLPALSGLKVGGVQTGLGFRVRF